MYRANKNISNYIKIVIRILQYFFVLLFVYAAVSKLLDFETFRVQLAQSPLLSAYAGILASAVPIAELVIAGLLCFEPTKKLGLSGFFFMMVMFSAYIFFILKFADFVPCSCGGVLEKMSWGQHLIFNLVFVALSGIILYFGMGGKRRRRWVVLGTEFILGIGVVGVLFAFSERKMQRNNAFQRRYLPHPVEKVSEYDLEYDTYYIAGVTDTVVYLGNYNAPLYLTAKNIFTPKKNIIHLKLDNQTLPFRKIRIEVKQAKVTIGDGTVPTLFEGNLSEEKLRQLPFDSVFFTEFIAIDTNNTAIVMVDSETGKKAIGSYTFSQKSSFISSPLKTGTPEPFADDGILTWNKNLNYFVYTYYYKNKFEVIDRELRPVYTGSTIDTINEPIIDVGYSKKKDTYTLGRKSIVVNRLSITSANYLFINSDRLGKFEDAAPLSSASIIDVYNILDRSYVFSFYLYHQLNGNLYDYQIYENLLIALVKDKLFIYKLKPEYFFGYNSKYTGQYQE